jgi:hypothetical protein
MARVDIDSCKRSPHAGIIPIRTRKSKDAVKAIPKRRAPLIRSDHPASVSSADSKPRVANNAAIATRGRLMCHLRLAVVVIASL